MTASTLSRSSAVPGSIRLRLLGRFELTVGGRPALPGHAAERVVAFLALRGSPLARVHVAASLWLETTDARASASLRSALWRVRRAGDGVIVTTPTHIRLSPEVALDVHDLVGVARELALDGKRLDRVPDVLVAGEVLPDWYEDWVLIERERLRQLRLHALDAVAERFLEASQFAAAAEAALAALESDPLRESTHRILVQTHLAEGNVSEAPRQLRLYRRLLAD